MDQATPSALVQQILGGSAEALATVYDMHAPAAYATAYRLLESVSDAEDVVHDVFLGLPHALRGYTGAGPLAAWIRRVTVRTALMRMRSQRRRREDPMPESAPGRARWELTSDRIDIRNALTQLEEPLRIVFLLKVVEGYAHEEIGEFLGISANASKTRLTRARAQLRRLLS